MALNQVIKIPSEQASFDQLGNKNNVDFILPEGNVYDLSRSYIAISTTNQFKDGNGIYFSRGIITLGDHIDNNGDTIVKSKVIPTMASLVKNAHISSQNSGKISDIRQVNKYAFVKSHYKKSTEDMRNDLGKMTPNCCEQKIKNGIAQEFSSYGNIESRYRTSDIRIPLHEIMPYCRTNAHDGNKQGATRIHTEINFDKIFKVNEKIEPADTAPKCNASGGGAAEIAGTILMQDMDTFAADNTQAGRNKTLTSLANYSNKNLMPFVVGEHIVVNFKAATVAQDAISTTIVEIKPSAIEERVDLVLASDLVMTGGGPLVNGNAISDIKVTDRVPTLEEFNITNVELVTEIVNDAPVPKGPVVYETILSEEDSYPASNSLNRVYDIPPMCKNVYIMFFKQGKLASDDEKLESYRLSIDNIEQTAQDVLLGSPLHLDQIQKTFLNNGEELNNIIEKYYFVKNDGASRAGIGANEKPSNFTIAQPVPFLQRSQKLQVELNAQTGEVLAGRHILYFDCVKEL